MVEFDSPIGVQDFASLVGLSRRAVSDLIKRGVLERPLVLGPSVKAYLAYVREGAGDVKTERARLAAAQAESWELKNKAARSEMISVAEVKATWAEVVLRIRDAVMAAPDRMMAQLPHLTRHDGSVIDKSLREALSGLKESAP